MRNSGDVEVAAAIVEKIKAQSLLNERQMERLGDSLEQGSLTASDWKLLAELSLQEDEKGATTDAD